MFILKPKDLEYTALYSLPQVVFMYLCMYVSIYYIALTSFF